MGTRWLGFFLFSYTLVFGQIRESDRLLQQSFETVYTNPDESIKVAEHLIKSTGDINQRAEAYLLSALGNYTKGAYDQSLEDAFDARSLSRKHDKVFVQSSMIISDILDFLQLQNELDNEILNSGRSQQYVQSFIRAKKGLLWQADSLKKQGQKYFEEKKNDSSIIVFQKGLKIAEDLHNPFLQFEIHQKLSAAHLALGNKDEYRRHYQEELALRNIITRLENSTSNIAHQRINQEKDNEFERVKRNYSRIFWTLVSFAGLCVLIWLGLILRNRTILRRCTTFLNYLSKKNSEESKQQVHNDFQKPTILKESEEQILSGLEKFEVSKRYLNKDMSLGMLASQLNTNTKYLSEIINRHKEKNFNSFINELRINYITEKIKSDSAYLNYKVSYLAEECGFASHSTFTTVFKSVVGVSPITFIDFIRKEIADKKEKITT